MRVQCVVSWIVAVGALTSWFPHPAVGQQLALAARTPGFFYAPSTDATPVEIDVSRSAVLGRVVSLQVERATIGGLLAEIQRQTGLTFAYDPHFPATRPITLEAESITVAAALGAILVGTGVDVVLTPTGHVWLTQSKPGTAHVQEGTIVGRVTDKQTGDPIMGATVTLEPTRRTTTTANDGHYRFLNLAAGNYTVRTRSIGYAPLVASVGVSAGEEVTVDFALDRSAQLLEQVVVTGTVIPTEVKGVPTPVSVISADDIALQRPNTVQELFRQAVPGSVSWDVPATPYSTAFSVRGASTFTGGTAQMKVFVDGIEGAAHNRDAIDPNSIERIEVIRGPQAAAIYGSDAIGGVVQIFTKRGDPSLKRPQVDGQATLGLVQTPYSTYDGVLRQAYTASIRGAAPNVGYNVGAGYSHMNDYALAATAQSTRSIYGGMHFERDVLALDLSARQYTQDIPSVFNPEFLRTGFPFFSKPYYQTSQAQNQTFGGRLTLTPTAWWRHTITAGIDRYGTDSDQKRPRLTTPADTFFSVSNATYTKTSMGYSSSVQAPLGPSLSGSLIVGVDHYSLRHTSLSTSRALTTSGNIQPAPGTSISAARTITNNTGYFAQAQLGLGDALFLTAGLRAEENTNFGDALGTPVSPRAGLSYVRQLGGMMLKLRGSYGRAIRAPQTGQKLATIGVISTVLANPNLGPERQKGWDVGADAVFGDRGSLGVTYYDQTADALIDYVRVDALSSPPTFQYQNVGRVKNSGVEVEAAVNVGPMHLKGQYGYARSRVRQLAPNYTGDLRVGDQAWLTPKHTAGVTLTAAPVAGTTLTAGLAYVGSWTYYAFLAQYGCLGGASPCRPTPRDYLIEYPSFVKVNASVSQQVTARTLGFVSIQNVTNSRAHEFFDFYPVTGRISTVGFRLQY
jgi:iron complex outermembrane receptor protein